MYIEMKRRKGGVISDEQRKWLGALRDEGYAAYVCKGWEEARDKMVIYLGLEKER